MANKTISNTFTVNTVEDGESTFDVTLDNQIVGVECDSNGNIIDSTPIILHLSAYYGNGEDLIAECYISESHDDDDIIVSEVDTGVIGVELTQGAYLAPRNPIVLTVRHPEYGTRVVTFSLNRIVKGKNGDNGTRGKVGRFYYFAETFNEQDTTTHFVVNDAQVPYFEHLVDGKKRYHVFNPETTPEGGSMTMAQMWAASNQSWNNAPWEVMTNDFKYLITEAIFARFALFGGAVINQEWMMSKYGVIYNSSGVATTVDATSSVVIGGITYTYNNAYLLFDSDYPNFSKPQTANFAPNYAVNLLTGVTYQKQANIEGVLRASAFYNKIGDIIEINGEKWLDLDGNNGNTYILHHNGTTYYLPKASDYVGLELNIWLKQTTALAVKDVRTGAETYLDKIMFTMYQGDSSLSFFYAAEVVKSTIDASSLTYGSPVQLLKIQAVHLDYADGGRDIRWVVVSQRGLIEAFENASDSSGRLITPEGKFFVRSGAETILWHNNRKYRLAISTDNYWTQSENVRINQT